MSEFVEFYLKDLTLNDESVLNWKKIETERYLLFYKLYDDGEKRGFEFISVGWAGSNYTGKDLVRHWSPDETIVNILYHGVAYFDGIRHLYLGHEKTDNYGYIHSPNIKKHMDILTELRKLEELYCRDIY